MARPFRHAAGRLLAGLLTLLFALVVSLGAPGTVQAKQASIVVEADSGTILHSLNADTRNFPASLTKMMTLYKIFEAVDNGVWRMSTPLEVSARAARQPASKLGLKAGTTIKVRDAIRALAIKSANDVATVVAENHSGSERAFAREMTATAKQLGMSRTTFRNASGLPHRGQLSTARDMAQLARALLQHFPHHYRFFAETEFKHSGKTYRNHNKLLKSLPGTDGIKTGYIRASGFNLVASTKRDGTRLIGVVFGGNTGRARDKRMKRILERSFADIGLAPSAAQVAVAKPTATPKASTKKTASKPKARPVGVVQGGPAGWGIQVGAFRQETRAQEAVSKALDALPSLLSETDGYVVPLVKRSGRTLYRARLYGLSKRHARRACQLLERKKWNCLVLRTPPGTELAAGSAGGGR